MGLLRLTGLAALLLAACTASKAAPEAGESAPEPEAVEAAASGPQPLSIDEQVPFPDGNPGHIGPPPAEPQPLILESAPTELILVDADLEPFRANFNGNQDRARMLALVSPTCGMCITGIRAIFDQILLGHPHSDLVIDVVWMRAQGAETEAEALNGAGFAPDARVRHYWDPQNLVGAALGRALTGRDELAWDTYLVFEPGVIWGPQPPEPADWSTQRATFDASHLPTQMDIKAELRRLYAQVAPYISE